MLICQPSTLSIGEIIIPLTCPLISLVCIGNKTGRIIRTDHESFKIDELYNITSDCILNNNFEIDIRVKKFSQIDYKEKFIYGDILYRKIKIDLEKESWSRGYDVSADSLKVVYDSEDVFSVKENK